MTGSQTNADAEKKTLSGIRRSARSPRHVPGDRQCFSVTGGSRGLGRQMPQPPRSGVQSESQPQVPALAACSEASSFWERGPGGLAFACTNGGGFSARVLGSDAHWDRQGANMSDVSQVGTVEAGDPRPTRAGSGQPQPRRGRGRHLSPGFPGECGNLDCHVKSPLKMLATGLKLSGKTTVPSNASAHTRTHAHTCAHTHAHTYAHVYTRARAP